jgi:hypothetical protein
MAKMTANFELRCTVRHDEDTDSYVSHCPDLNIFSGGHSELEALEGIRSAISLLLEWAYKQKTLGSLLGDMGMRFAPKKEDFSVDADTDVGAIGTQSVPIHVPFYLLQQDQAATR